MNLGQQRMVWGDLDEVAKRDELKLHGERPALAGHGGDRKSEDVEDARG
jgi:hypothetical protein